MRDFRRRKSFVVVVLARLRQGLKKPEAFYFLRRRIRLRIRRRIRLLLRWLFVVQFRLLRGRRRRGTGPE